MQGLVLLATIAWAGLTAVFLVAPLMFSAGAATRAAIRNCKRSSELRLACFPLLAELFVALAFNASLTGGVRALLECYPGASRAWLWSIAFLIGALPGAVRWTWDFLADPSGRVSPLPAGLEISLLQPPAFLLFAARPDLVATAWGWVPFAGGASHPAWASVLLICGAAACLRVAAVWSKRQVPFVPLVGNGLLENGKAFSAGAGR